MNTFGDGRQEHRGGNIAGIFERAWIPLISATVAIAKSSFIVLDPIAVQLRRLHADERGTLAATMGILMIPLVGFLALGFEVSNWYMITRSMQSAADAATIAAAVNNSASYDVEARAVAAQYGFVNGANNINVAVTNTARCPDGGNYCYRVSISGYTPLLLSQVVGFRGNGNINGTPQKRLSAVAVATPNGSPQCLLALATSGAPQGIRTNGAPFANMRGCSSMSNTAAQCNGYNLGLGVSFAAGSNSGRGNKQVQIPSIGDPYLGQIRGNIKVIHVFNPDGYPQEQGKNGPPLLASSGSGGLPNTNVQNCRAAGLPQPKIPKAASLVQ